MKSVWRKSVALLLTVGLISGLLAGCSEKKEQNGDIYTRCLSVRTDMVHDNPGEDAYVTQYDDVSFLAQRGLSGKVFFLSEAAQLAIDWQAYDPKVFPADSEAYGWVQDKKAELHEKYGEAKEQGLKVYFMMDFISLPTSMKDLYGDQILTNGKIDINKPKTKDIMKEMMREIFAEFPEVDGFYLRYGESYVGFYSPYHFGNNPIAVSGSKADDHTSLLKFFRDEVCEAYGKEVVYRTWSTEVGEDSFTTSKNLYLQITDGVEPHGNLYLAIKHTAGDFWRNYTFNETIGVGKHQQIVEVQCSREYEGKGAYPNYVAGNVINGFPEYEWQMSEGQNKCLRDVVNCENSLVQGVWTWSRGGGWGGPYTNGTKNRKGDEVWSDLNAYVLHEWAKDTSVTDRYLVRQYAKEVLGMKEKDAENFLRLAELSAEAVLYGIGTNTSPAMEPLWTRDSGVNADVFLRNLSVMIGQKEGDVYPKLEERKKATELFREIVRLAEGFSDDVEKKEYLVVTSRYGLCLFSLWEQMWTAGVLYSEQQNGTDRQAELTKTRDTYDSLWKEWETLSKNTPACPTLYDREGFDKVIDRFK